MFISFFYLVDKPNSVRQLAGSYIRENISPDSYREP